MKQLMFFDFIQKPKSSFTLLCLLVIIRRFRLSHRSMHMIVLLLCNTRKDHGKYLLMRLLAYTKPILKKKYLFNTDVEVHTVTSHEDLPLYLTMAKTLHNQSQINYPFVLHDDGTLTEQDFSLIKEHIPDIRVLSHSKTTKKLETLLRSYPVLLRRRLDSKKDRVQLIVTIDVPLFSKSKKLCYIDSDIVFFNNPQELSAWAVKNDDAVLFANDRKNGYAISRKVCKKFFHVDFIEKFNAGILCYQKSLLSLPHLNSYFSTLKTIRQSRNFLQEQTYWMIRLQQTKQKLIRLSDLYLIPMKRHGDRYTVARHYIHPIRNQLYASAITTLITSHMIDM